MKWMKKMLCLVGIGPLRLFVDNNLPVRSVKWAIACVRCLQTRQRTDD
jgi:hypothetical protein